MSREAMQMALEALETNNKAWKHLTDSGDAGFWEAEEQPFYELSVKAITALRQALEKPKYRRGDRLLCRETEEYCVIHIGGTDRQYVKFPGGFVGEYTNAQIDELFELLPKEVDQREWVGLTDQEVMVAAYQAGFDIHEDYENEDDPEAMHWWTPDGEACDDSLLKLRDLIEAKLKEKNQ